MLSQAKYVLISPCKNEGQYIEKTLASVRAQSVPPAQWIIVDDGSTDNGMELVARYQREMPFIRIVTRPPGARRVGGGVVEAFNEGMRNIDVPDYEFLCKLDVDLDLPPRYFELLLGRMARDPRLGTCSGKPYYRDERSGALRSELCGDEASVGMTKFYRRQCFEQIGGFVSEVGWDGYDCHRARWFGWRAQSWGDEPDLRFLHLRPMGSSQKSIYHGRIRHGKGQFHIGTHPVFFLASSVYRLLRQKPYVTGTVFSVYGFLKSYVDGSRRFGDRDLVKFIRTYQMRALRSGKAAAAEWIFRERCRDLGLDPGTPATAGS